MTTVKKNASQAKFTDEDIKIFAQAFDVLLEGAIQTHQISKNGKLAVQDSKSGGCDD